MALEATRTNLVTKGMSSDNDWLGPSRYRSWYTLQNDRFAEHRASQDVPNRPIRAPPHRLQLEFFYTGFVRGDGSAFDPYRIFKDSLSGLDGDFIVRSVSMFQA